MDLIDKIIKYESGDMEQDEMIEFFQYIIDDGSVWTMAGRYGRVAQALLDSGLCKQEEVKITGDPVSMSIRRMKLLGLYQSQ